MNKALVWFRRDLRLSDNPALQAAIKNNDLIIPVFIHAPEEEAPWQPGAASNWWLHYSLEHLSSRLNELGSPLIFRQGPTITTLKEIALKTGASRVYWNRLYEPAIRERDAQVKKSLSQASIECFDHGSALLFEPGTILTKTEQPYKVFTPFWRTALSRMHLNPPLPPPSAINTYSPLDSLELKDLQLLPKINWDQTFHDHWQPGELNSLKQLDLFIESNVRRYAELRNRPDIKGTSRLSASLHFGEITPQQVAWAIELSRVENSAQERDMEVFMNEIGWREFAHHLLVHFPHTTSAPLRENFSRFPWRKGDTDDFKAWCQGKTGIPMIDAGMRELWHTGWMHNRVRMVVASFLTKNQLISWQAGAHWFWDTLVDANLASNTLGWQWTAGCGADAAPFFRIFNPVRQGERFDADETYVRLWCPELQTIKQGCGHTPWLDKNPLSPPIVDLSHSRQMALDAYAQIRQS
ncbi:MAG: DNA photolyase family protein [Gammaproteobacteria bacterium]|nr:DNA photolyase family protein [Gammaproteobacteria bacterium]